ncbi:MAG TPA: NAD-dependent epimerase/dehydratase family protein [Ktedonobacterales bacterium]|nr:NAD-dependent epimerase/dehydratase family protein [Ktedonobacterales bacterium]
MHILVIGGTRNVGYLLVWRLLAAGHRVTLLNRGSQTPPFHRQVEMLRADRATPDFARQLAGRSFDAAVDFAAYTAADARQALALLGDGRVGQYIFISTGQVYLVRETCPTPSREADYDGALMPEPVDPYDLEEWRYGVYKREAEDLLARAWASERFPVTRLRLPMVNGERDHFRRIEGYLWRILDGGPILLPDGGANTVRHVYSGSVVKAIAGLLGQPATLGQVYNLAQEEMPTLAELVSLLAELLGAPARLLPVSAAQLQAVNLQPADISPFSDRWMSCLDPSRARAELGFQHEPLASYLGKIVTSFLAHAPAAPPENYRHRPVELALAASLPKS